MSKAEGLPVGTSVPVHDPPAKETVVANVEVLRLPVVPSVPARAVGS